MSCRLIFVWLLVFSLSLPRAVGAASPSSCHKAISSSTDGSSYSDVKALSRLYVQELDIKSVADFIQFVREERPDGLSVSPGKDFPNEFEGWSVFLDLPSKSQAVRKRSALPRSHLLTEDLPTDRDDLSDKALRPEDRDLSVLDEAFRSEGRDDLSVFDEVLRPEDFDFGSKDSSPEDNQYPDTAFEISDLGDELFFSGDPKPQPKRKSKPSRETKPRTHSSTTPQKQPKKSEPTGKKRKSRATGKTRRSSALPPKSDDANIFQKLSFGKPGDWREAQSMVKSAGRGFKREGFPPREIFEIFLKSFDIRTKTEYYRLRWRFDIHFIYWSDSQNINAKEKQYPLPRHAARDYPGFHWREWSEKMNEERGGRRMKEAVPAKEDLLPRDSFERLTADEDILTKGEYRKWRLTKRAIDLAKPYKLPPNAEHHYPGFRWNRHAAKAAEGGGRKIKPRLKKEDAPPFEMFKSLLRNHDINSRGEYKDWRVTEEAVQAAKPYKLPSKPGSFYRSFGFMWSKWQAKSGKRKGGVAPRTQTKDTSAHH